MDAALLRRLDKVCDARNQARSQVIERIVGDQIEKEEGFVKDMENPVLRTVLNAMVNTPGLIHTMAKLVGQNMTDEELDNLRVGAKEQIEYGKARQQLKKNMPEIGKVEPA